MEFLLTALGWLVWVIIALLGLGILFLIACLLRVVSDNLRGDDDERRE